MNSKELLNAIAVERPVGTPANHTVCDDLENQLKRLGYEVDSLPFECLVWEKEPPHCEVAGQKFPLAVSPYSRGYEGTAPFLVVESLEALKEADAAGKILILRGELTAEPLQPKDHPFYYPDHHRAIIDALEQSGCVAMLAVTGQHPMCGLNPFPLVLDGNFTVPATYLGEAQWQQIADATKAGGEMSLVIRSRTEPAQSRQVAAEKPSSDGKGKILVCAHMDSVYDTPAALDNAAGTAMLMQTAARCAKQPGKGGLAFVPFNGEEYFAYTGQMAYLEQQEEAAEPIRLAVNIDSPCHRGSKIAVATYNFGEKQLAALRRLIEQSPNVVEGEPWYAGDHVPFALKGIPCLSVASSDFADGGLADTHTLRDTVDTVDIPQIDEGAAFLAQWLATDEAWQED